MKVKIITALVLILILSLTFMACQEDIAINGFSIDLSNLTLEIEKGTDVDFSKIIVNAERVDDTSIPLKSNQYSIDLGGFDKDVPGEYTITITYGSYGSKTFIVIVSDKAADAKTVSSIAVSTNSTHKTAFAYNEAFSYANLTIEVTYTDGTNENITEGFEVVSTEYNKAHGMGSAKDYLITVNYGSQSTSYAISVAADPSKVIKSIKAVGSFKTQYNYYESFTAENVELEVTTEDNNTSIISNGFDVDSTAFNKLHGQTEAQIYNIKLTYMSKECSYNVTVAGGIVSNIVAVNTEADRTFKYGQPFSWGDTKVYAQYENSEYIELLTRSETTGAGKYSFEVAYNHDHKQSTAQTFTITVKYSAEITSFYTVSVAKMPDDMFYRVSNDSTHKTEFLEDEEFSYEGLILEKVSASEVAAAAQDPNYALYPIAVTIPRDCEIECNNFNSNQKGYYAVYAVADGTSYYLYSVYVDIDDNNLAVSITPNNFSTKYYVGQNLNLTGCSITITYQDGSTTELFLPSNQVTINGFNSETIGKITLTVNYGELQAVVSNIDIVEDEVVGIAIADNSKHRVYFYYAEPFSGNGLIVNAVYASGKIRTLSAGEYSIDESEYGIESNNYFIAIRYEEIEINYKVFVAAFEAETKPYFLGYDYNSFFEVSDNNWEIIFGERGSHSFAATLEADTLSTISVMVGKWMGGEDFLALNPDEYGYYSIYYTATSILTLTVRITHANGIDYVDHYAHIKPTIFNSFTVNGDEIILNADKVVDYFINDISNEYMVNWSINEEYTV